MPGVLLKDDFYSTCVATLIDPRITIGGIPLGALPEESTHPHGDSPKPCSPVGEDLTPIAGVSVLGQSVFSIGTPCGCEDSETHVYGRGPYYTSNPTIAFFVDSVTMG